MREEATWLSRNDSLWLESVSTIVSGSFRSVMSGLGLRRRLEEDLLEEESSLRGEEGVDLWAMEELVNLGL